VKRVTPGESLCSEKQSFQGPVQPDGIVGVLGTGWGKSATGADEWGNQQLIGSNEHKKNSADHMVRSSYVEQSFAKLAGDICGGKSFGPWSGNGNDIFTRRRYL